MAASLEFGAWLRRRLDEVGLDGDVYTEYISGTLDDMVDATNEEQLESLQDLLAGALEDSDQVCQSIIDQWSKHHQQQHTAAVDTTKSISLQEQVDELLRGTTDTTSEVREGVVPSRPPAMSEREKVHLLQEYDCTEDDTIDITSGTGGQEHSKDEASAINPNVLVVAQDQKLHREQMKAAHEAKLERDKKSREQQRQRAQDRKEKEKQRTQKKERRR